MGSGFRRPAEEDKEMQITSLEISKDLSEAFFNPPTSLFRPNALDLLTADQLARHLGVKVGWVKRQSRAGNIPSIKLGKCYRYRKSDVDLWLSEKAKRG
jgi:excisionase family DNA binding protein